MLAQSRPQKPKKGSSPQGEPHHTLQTARRPVAWHRAGIAILVLVMIAGLGGFAQEVIEIDLSTPEMRAQTVQRLSERSIRWRQEAEAIATAQGWPIRAELPDGTLIELQAVVDGRPMYYTTLNVNAAISTAANLVRNTSPYNVNGALSIAAVWDGGAVLGTHQELTGRVTVRDGTFETHPHSTHVAGTIGATGVIPDAQGMAPSVQIYSYDWNNDTAEMAGAGATAPNQAGKVYVSNHSYGLVTGWMYSYIWWGVWPEREDRGFGIYDMYAWDWDAVAYAAPYYLIFKSAGNDRSDTAPEPGGVFYYYYNGQWWAKAYDPATDPYDDGYDQGGFDTIPYDGNAKNIMTIGAVNDAVLAGMRHPASGTMSSFSGWGPADDGRIKPDIVANGIELYSPVDTNNQAYDVYSGTSMSSPNACGSAVLLTEYFGKQFPGDAMRASTLKALIIHTADDLGRPGPDYSFGWGLMNTKAAADLILAHKNSPTANHGIESWRGNEPIPTEMGFVWDGASPIRATLCWTDPPGPIINALDDPTPVLVNDLDLRVVGPGDTVYYPYRLDRLNPTTNAVTGDNTVDNVEQVYIAAPSTPGTYRVRISDKEGGNMTDNFQRFSLILTGQTPDDLNVTPVSGFVSTGIQTGPFQPSSATYTLENIGSTALNWSWNSAGNQTWFAVNPPSGTLQPAESTSAAIELTAAAGLLPAGVYAGHVAFINDSSGASHIRGVRLTVEPYRSQPEVRDLVLSPSQPYTENDLTATFTYYDPNLHEQGATELKWYKNGVHQPAYDDLNPLPASATRPNEAWFVEVRVYDGVDLEASEWTASNVVTVVNRLPVFQPIGNKEVDEGETLTFQVVVSEGDGDPVQVTIDLAGLPGEPRFNPVTLVFAWVTDFDSAGTYSVTFSATDNVWPVQTVTETAVITVNDVCPQPPAPQNVQASDGTFADRIRVTFEAVQDAVSYKIYRNSSDYVATADLIGVWNQTMFDDYSVPIVKQAAMGCFPQGGAQPKYYYWVSAVNDCMEGPKGRVDSGYVGSGVPGAKSLESTYESALPSRAVVGNLLQAQIDSEFSIRLRAPEDVNPGSVWGKVSYGGVETHSVLWQPSASDNADGWVSYWPGKPLEPGTQVVMTAGAETVTGRRVGPVTYRFSVETEAVLDARLDQPGQAVAQPALDLISGSADREEPATVVVLRGLEAPPPFAEGLGEPYRVGPEQVFDPPRQVWLPLPEGCSADQVRLYYYRANGPGAGWYPAENVVGWAVSKSYQVVEADGVQYATFRVRHGGVCQFGLASSASATPAAAIPAPAATGDTALLALTMLALLAARRRFAGHLKSA